MEIPGDYYKPFIGLVNQTTFVPTGRLTPWKMTRTTLEAMVNEVDTPNNAVPNYDTAIPAKRRATGTVHQASFDPSFNIYGINPFVVPPALGITLREGLYIRAMMVPDTSVAGPMAIGDFIGTPIFGAAGELPATAPTISYIFLTLLITRIRHEADAAAGQPFDFDFRTVNAYAMPGENLTVVTAYGFSATIGAGGFL